MHGCSRRRQLLEKGVLPCKANVTTAAELGRFMLFIGQQVPERDPTQAA
nr:hypothetical protein [Atopobium sp. oral taxon 416]